jgi:hypothetical protein
MYAYEYDRLPAAKREAIQRQLAAFAALYGGGSWRRTGRVRGAGLIAVHGSMKLCSPACVRKRPAQSQRGRRRHVGPRQNPRPILCGQCKTAFRAARAGALDASALNRSAHRRAARKEAA